MSERTDYCPTSEQERALRDVLRMAREADTSPQTADRWAERIEDRINEVLGGDHD